MRGLPQIVAANEAAVNKWANDRAKTAAVFAAAERVVNAVMSSDRDKAIRDLRAALYGEKL